MAETAIVGAAIGLAIAGMRPIVELQFADFISCAYDQLVTEAAKLHYRFGIAVPMVVRAPSGGDVGAGPFHSQNPEGIFAHVPGLKVVCPGNVQDAYDLLRAAVRDPNPVLYFEHKAPLPVAARAARAAGAAPSRSVDAAVVRRAGSDVTVVTYGGDAAAAASTAAEELAAEGIDVEVLDLRTVFPADHAAVGESVRAHRPPRRRARGHAVVRHRRRDRRPRGRATTSSTSTRRSPGSPRPTRPCRSPRPLEHAYIPSVERITDRDPEDGGGMSTRARP